MVLLETLKKNLKWIKGKNEIPRVSYHKVLQLPRRILRNEPDVTSANSHQIQQQLLPNTSCQSTINLMSIITIKRITLNSTDIT